jgi:hypothetical protein
VGEGVTVGVEVLVGVRVGKSVGRYVSVGASGKKGVGVGLEFAGATTVSGLEAEIAAGVGARGVSAAG